MSTNTAKEEKPSILETLKAQAAEISAKIKAETDKHLETLHTKLQDLHKQVASVTEEIQKHTGKPVPAKRGRKPGSKVGKTAPKTRKKAKGKRGQLGQSITDFLASKGKGGAHVKDIAAHIGSKPLNVTAWIYTTGKAKVKKVKPATFALKK